MKPLIQVQAVSQRFNTASGEFLALQNVSFDIVEGETISLIGHSGCGKSVKPPPPPSSPWPGCSPSR